MKKACILLILLLSTSLLIVPRFIGDTMCNPDVGINESIRQVEQALALYTYDTGGFPAVIADLCYGRKIPGWNGPYAAPCIPKDPWNMAIEYQQFECGYRIWSRGPDKKCNTDDDIVKSRFISGVRENFELMDSMIPLKAIPKSKRNR